MQKLTYEIEISASKQAVYEAMIGHSSYRQWTKPFNPTSDYQGDWSEGSKMLFVGVDSEGKKRGMVSRIRANRPGEYVFIEHIGVVDGDREITDGAEISSWSGAQENYRFSEENGKTRVSVEMDSEDGFIDYLNKTWPKALEELRKLCEQEHN